VRPQIRLAPPKFRVPCSPRSPLPRCHLAVRTTAREPTRQWRPSSTCAAPRESLYRELRVTTSSSFFSLRLPPLRGSAILPGEIFDTLIACTPDESARSLLLNSALRAFTDRSVVLTRDSVRDRYGYPIAAFPFFVPFPFSRPAPFVLSWRRSPLSLLRLSCFLNPGYCGVHRAPVVSASGLRQPALPLLTDSPTSPALISPFCFPSLSLSPTTPLSLGGLA